MPSVIKTNLLAALALVAATLVAVPAEAADTVSGPATRVDADIIMVGKQRVILWAVDAPERSQFCLIDTKKWGCYEAATRVLDDILKTGEVTCTLQDGKPDPFGRRYGVCKIGDTDIAAELVKQGYALALTDQGEDYSAIQKEAEAAKVGLWRDGVKFENPWDWRRTRTPGGFR
ncbi:thermonuclease family protein [Paradevosia shaoguanensis]|uniref:Thermonuclease family protein n=1 Tax=Paradevosia shaoguanensis TaxID=1335043 RepID=A0AA41QPI2_9HYPH|nr:thermonuclease family protein [Paradevosia shaoguanensis]MCF1743730.1 thermonuclease family protein [Paradevosia shaoguanensis]MCI0128213.1 thermonuclease family protein [Paradevosia shaoguanensis]